MGNNYPPKRREALTNEVGLTQEQLAQIQHKPAADKYLRRLRNGSSLEQFDPPLHVQQQIQEMIARIRDAKIRNRLD